MEIRSWMLAWLTKLILEGLIDNTKSHILRLECQGIANFSIEKQNKVMPKSVIDSFMHLTLQECKAHCLYNNECRSINYQDDGDKKCQLNNRTTEDARYRVVLKRRSGWRYLTTDHKETKVGHNCQKYSPCREDQLCLDTCSCPGYRCIQCKPNEIGLPCHRVWRDCDDAKNSGYTENGVYVINPTEVPENRFEVYCDMKTRQKAWVVFQRRRSNSMSFERNWQEYEDGFGSLYHNFWLGLKKLYYLTKDRTAILRIELKSWRNLERKFAKYAVFSVSGPSDNYRLQALNYSSDSTLMDSLTPSANSDRQNANGMQFSTYDKDNDLLVENCASDYKGGWWHNKCFEANLNNLYDVNGTAGNNATYVSWTSLHGVYGGIKSTTMKLGFNEPLN